MSKSEIIRFLILRSIGNFLVLFAIFGFFATFGPALYYEVQFRIASLRGIRYIIDDEEATVTSDSDSSQLGDILKRERLREQQEIMSPSGSFADVLVGPTEQILIPKDTEFSVLILKIGATAKIFPNVDSSNQDEFLPILQQGIAHAKGTVFPGHKGNVYLFAHSTDNFWDAGRYNAVFYLLKDLTQGDDIVVFFENLRHNYTVVESKVIDAQDVLLLVGSQQGKEEQLILQTCWPPGTTWKRLVVIAKPK